MDIIHSRPSVRLGIINLERNEPLDVVPLMSAQLHSVDYNIRYDDFGSQRSELPIFRDLLVQARNLKVLILHMDQFGRAPGNFYDATPLNLQFRENDRLPALEELTLDCYDIYDLSHEHCMLWTKCMDWSFLRKLDLDKGCPHYLLEALTGKVPELKSLAFGFPHYRDSASTWNFDDLNFLISFLGSIDGLEEVKINAWDDGAYGQIRPFLLEKHGKSLKHLNAEYKGVGGWNGEDIARLYESSPDLMSLSTVVHVRQEPESEYESTWVRKQVLPYTIEIAKHLYFSLSNLRPYFPSSVTSKNSLSESFYGAIRTGSFQLQELAGTNQ
jgi:hypothetical protein